MSLILYDVKDKVVDLDELAAISTPPPTKTWQPIPHMAVVGTAAAAMTDAGLQVTNSQHGVSKDGARYFGLMQVGNQAESGFNLTVGLRNSHDKALTAGIALGARVLVCSNLSFSGEVLIGRRHTPNILNDLPGLIRNAIDYIPQMVGQQNKQFEAYQNVPVSRQVAHDLTIRLLDASAIKATEVPHVLNAWRRPQHEEFLPRNVWSYFNSVTEVLKGKPAQTTLERTRKLHRVVDAYTRQAQSYHPN